MKTSSSTSKCLVFLLLMILLFEVSASKKLIKSNLPQGGCKSPHRLTSDQLNIPTEKDVAKTGDMAGIKPLHYDWTVNFSNNMSKFKSKLNIKIQANKETKSVMLNVLELKIDYETVYGRKFGSGKINCLESFSELLQEETVVLKFQYSFEINEVFEIVFPKFLGKINVMNKYSSGIMHNDKTSSKNWAITTLFQMRKARTAFPCFDHPALKATYKVCITHPQGTEALSNTEVQHHFSTNGIITDCFAKTGKMSTYLVGVSLLSNYRKVEDRSQHPTIEAFFTEETFSDYSGELAVARRVFNFFQKDLGLNYNMSKCGLLYIQDFTVGGMENFGLISMIEHAGIGTLVHEIVHQWVGNVITVSHWDEICLQEGLTTYLQLEIIARLNLKRTHSSTKNYKQPSDRNILIRPYADEKIGEVFANCYKRSVFYLSKISNMFGRDVWFSFLQRAVAKYGYGNMNLEQFIEVLNEVAGTNEAGEKLKLLFTATTPTDHNEQFIF